MRSDASTHAGYDPAVAATVLAMLHSRLCNRRAPWLVGLSGLQGSGKSTLASQLERTAESDGVPTTVLSIDDFYLGRRERMQLARRIHPLLQTRGVPGTHDLALLDRALASLRGATAANPALLPRFDKGRDTRMPPSRWRKVRRPPRLVIVEGWCVGVPAQVAGELRRSVNVLERDEDADETWRRHVNEELAAAYQPLWQRLDALILLEAPGFEAVSQWRDEQERPLRLRHASHALDAAALSRFLMHYERLSRHSLRVLPARADIRIVLDRRRRVSKILSAPAGRCARAASRGRTGRG